MKKGITNVNTRIEIIKQIEKQVSYADIAKEFGISKSGISKIKKKKRVL